MNRVAVVPCICSEHDDRGANKQGDGAREQCMLYYSPGDCEQTEDTINGEHEAGGQDDMLIEYCDVIEIDRAVSECLS